MKVQNVWEAPYSRSRRKRAHRCRCCWKVLEEGAAALWLRHSRGKVTWVLHLACATRPSGTAEAPGPTWREQFEAWGAA